MLKIIFLNQEIGENQHITRFRAYVIFNKAVRNIGIQEEIGTHTLRKTFGYHYYQQTHDIATLQELFNHSSPSITLKYIRYKSGHFR